MPWRELSPVEQRTDFVREYESGLFTMTELAAQYGVSRKTGYKWIARFMAGCELVDRSRRPKSSPRAVPAELEDAIVAARKSRPTWGPRKLRAATQTELVMVLVLLAALRTSDHVWPP